MSGSIRVLYVDDDREYRDVTSEALESESDRLDVETVASAGEGLGLLETHDIDCILSDYEMPETDGLEFLERVRTEYPELPFVLFTGKGSEEVAAEALSAGATEYLQKGGDVSQYTVLANRIENAVEQHRANRRSERAARRRRQMLERITDGYAKLDEDLTITELNRKGAEFVGAPREELLGTRYDELVAESARDDPDSFRDLYESVIATGEPQRAEGWSNVRPDRYVELRAFPAEDGGVYVYVRDVTERKHRELERERERDRTLALFEHLPNPAVYAKLRDSTPIVERANPAFAETFGYTPDEVVGENLQDLVVPRNQRTEAGFLVERVYQEGQYSVEVERRTTDGIRQFLLSVVVTDREEDEPEGYAIYTDITEQKRRERTVRSLHDVVTEFAACDTPEAVYRQTVDSAASLLAFDRAAIAIETEEGPLRVETTTDAFSFEDPPTLAADEGLAGRTYRTGESFLRRDMQSVDDETELTVNSALSVPVGDVGVFLAVDDTPAAFDDGDRQLAEGLVSYAEAALNRLDRERALQRQNERLEAFRSVVSHDLRNPLTVAKLRLDLAQEECESEHLADVSTALDRMDSLLDGLLTVARTGEGGHDLEPVDLEMLAAECWETVVTGESTLLVESSRTIRADRNRLKQLLENLISNAVEHGSGPGDSDGPDAGAVTVTVGALDRGFYVADDGPGIPPDQRESVFESGYSTSDGGTGFGLTIVSEVAEAHGWTVEVTEGADGGARFEITGVE